MRNTRFTRLYSVGNNPSVIIRVRFRLAHFLLCVYLRCIIVLYTLLGYTVAHSKIYIFFWGEDGLDVYDTIFQTYSDAVILLYFKTVK